MAHEGLQWLRSRALSAPDVYNRAHDPNYNLRGCPIRIVSDAGDVYTKETFPKPEMELVITPNPDLGDTGREGADLPGVGYWIGQYSMCYPDPRKYIDKTKTPEQRKALAKYLENGKQVASFIGSSWCRFCGACMGYRAYSDGKYVWPEGLSHYVLAHELWIPVFDGKF